MKQDIPYDLIVKQLNQSASEQEMDDLKIWLESSEQHKTIYKNILKTWKIQKALNYEVDKAKAWDKLSDQLKLDINKRPKYNILRRVAQVAAMLILMIGMGLLFHYKDQLWSHDLIYVQTQDTQDTILLADGSEVFLNRNSELIYPETFDSDKRLVKLKGEAFFKVKPNPKKAFLIETTNSRTEVLGTSFNIRAYPKDSINQISVSTGKVAFSSIDNSQKVILTPRQTGVYWVQKNSIQKKAIEDLNYKAWLDKNFVFNNENFTTIIETLSQAYGVKIDIQNKTLNNEYISTSFSELDLNDALDLLSETLGFEHRNINHTIIIY